MGFYKGACDSADGATITAYTDNACTTKFMMEGQEMKMTRTTTCIVSEDGKDDDGNVVEADIESEKVMAGDCGLLMECTGTSGPTSTGCTVVTTTEAEEKNNSSNSSSNANVAVLSAGTLVVAAASIIM